MIERSIHEFQSSGEREDARRDAYFRLNYNISLEDYNALLDAQDGGCAICGVAPTHGRALKVDHDHKCCAQGSCGKCVRGLLCNRCNLSIGKFEDNASLLRAAADYLDSQSVGMFTDPWLNNLIAEVSR